MPELDETPDEFVKRVNDVERPVSAKVRVIKNRPDWPIITAEIDKITRKHKQQADIDEEVKANKVLQNLKITEV